MGSRVALKGVALLSATPKLRSATHFFDHEWEQEWHSIFCRFILKSATPSILNGNIGWKANSYAKILLGKADYIHLIIW